MLTSMGAGRARDITGVVWGLCVVFIADNVVTTKPM